MWRTILIVLLSLVGLTGCFAINGSVTDAATGEPIADARVGFIKSSLFVTHVRRYEERTRSDANGAFSVRSFVSWPVTVEKEDYITQTIYPIDVDPSATQQFHLENMAAIKGRWDVTIAEEGGQSTDYVLEFREDSLVFVDEFYDANGANVAYRFDGESITIDDYITMFTDYTVGFMHANLTYDPVTDRISGAVLSFGFDGSPLDEGSAGTFSATPR